MKTVFVGRLEHLPAVWARCRKVKSASTDGVWRLEAGETAFCKGKLNVLWQGKSGFRLPISHIESFELKHYFKNAKIFAYIVKMS